MNTLIAIKNLILNQNTLVNTNSTNARNRIQSVGSGLEDFVKHLYSSILINDDENQISVKYRSVFSYTGNSNNPPDAMLKNGDAIEIKKIMSSGSSLALNSSYPKSKLLKSNPYISKACVDSEVWDCKDIVYAIGSVPVDKLTLLWLVYGDCYAASVDTYAKIKTAVADGINRIPDTQFSDTKELGRVNKVDPLGITNLRIRGMWEIQHPNNVYSYLNCIDKDSEFQMHCIMKRDKYLSFPIEHRTQLEGLISDVFTIHNVKINDPDNPIKQLEAVLISYKCK